MVHKVEQTHPQYDAFVDAWKTSSDALEGETAIKAEGTRYLPSLTSQTASQYAAYKDRAIFFGAPARTVTGVAGAINSKPPKLALSEKVGNMLSDIGKENESLHQIVATVTGWLVSHGRVGIFVDADKQEGATPYITLYSPMAITNWDTTVVEGREILTLVVLHEPATMMDPTTLEHKEVDRYRLLQLQPNGPNGQLEYSYEVWEHQDQAKGVNGQASWLLVDEGVPKRAGGMSFKDIPFEITNDCDTKIRPKKPPLIDLVTLAISHYKNSADLEHGRHFTALPTAVAMGFDTKQDWVIGSGIAWVTDAPDANAKYLEFTGQGLGHLASGMLDKEKMMAVLGARLLEEQPRQAEAFGTVRLRQTGEKASMSAIAATISEAMTTVLGWITEWMGGSKEGLLYKLEPTTNFEGLDPQMLAQMLEAVLAGVVSWESFFELIKKGGLIASELSAEEEATLLAKGIPFGIHAVAEAAAAEAAATDDEDDDDDDDEEDTKDPDAEG